MKRMSRMPTKKSHSWWWNSHISPKNSKWLAENLEEMDRCVKEMLKLIEEEGDSFAKKAEMYYKKRPELVSHVEDFYRMYRALAERYDQVTGELRRNIPTELQSQGSGSGSDHGSEPPSPSLLQSPEPTPERRPPRPKPSPRAAGFDFFLGSGGSSDYSRKESDGSSSSESGSDSDDLKDGNGDVASGLQPMIPKMGPPRLRTRIPEILEIDNEFQEHENGSNGQCEHRENVDHEECSSRIAVLEKKLVAADEKLRAAEVEVSRLNQMLVKKNPSIENELSSERNRVSGLEELVSVLEVEISRHMQEIEGMRGAQAAATARFNHEIDVCKAEKIRLESEVTNLKGAIEEVKSGIIAISVEKSMFEIKIMDQDHELESNAARFQHEKSALEAQVGSLKAKLVSLEGDVCRLEANNQELIEESGKRNTELNHNLDELKLKAGALSSDLKSRNEMIGRMDEHMHQLHLEHSVLITEIETVRRAGKELRGRVKELEEEVERQRAAVLEGAEQKREAIRQLCFSLEHYRDGYCQLRRLVMGGNKRAVVMAT